MANQEIKTLSSLFLHHLHALRFHRLLSAVSNTLSRTRKPGEEKDCSQSDYPCPVDFHISNIVDQRMRNKHAVLSCAAP